MSRSIAEPFRSALNIPVPENFNNGARQIRDARLPNLPVHPAFCCLNDGAFSSEAIYFGARKPPRSFAQAFKAKCVSLVKRKIAPCVQLVAFALFDFCQVSDFVKPCPSRGIIPSSLFLLPGSLAPREEINF